jgi:hypothetical protein
MRHIKEILEDKERSILNAVKNRIAHSIQHPCNYIFFYNIELYRS